MKRYLAIISLVLGLVLAPTAGAQSLTFDELIRRVIVAQDQQRLLEQQQGLLPTNSGIYLNQVNELGNVQPNLAKPGSLLAAYGRGFKPVMQVIIHGQGANKTYTSVLTALVINDVGLFFILPADTPAGLIDLHLADGTTPRSRVSNTLLVAVP